MKDLIEDETEQARTLRLARKWISRWSFTTEPLAMPQIHVEKYLKTTRPTEPITLYRFQHKNEQHLKRFRPYLPLQSWSRSQEAAEAAAECETELGRPSIVVKKTFQPHEVYADFSKVPGADSVDEVLVYKYPPQNENLIEAAITHELEDNEIIFRVTELLKPYKKSLGRLTKEGKGIKIETNAQVYNPTQGVDYPATVVVKVGMEESIDLVELLNKTLKLIANEYFRKTISLMSKEYWSLAILCQ